MMAAHGNVAEILMRVKMASSPVSRNTRYITADGRVTESPVSDITPPYIIRIRRLAVAVLELDYPDGDPYLVVIRRLIKPVN